MAALKPTEPVNRLFGEIANAQLPHTCAACGASAKLVFRSSNPMVPGRIRYYRICESCCKAIVDGDNAALIDHEVHMARCPTSFVELIIPQRPA